ncbi:hypothetical protein Vi05172_g8871 [Venturia inaequalis]|nr:hypothetical protein Vi05172_g8871 [Venturia inaequalis]
MDQRGNGNDSDDLFELEYANGLCKVATAIVPLYAEHLPALDNAVLK